MSRRARPGVLDRAFDQRQHAQAVQIKMEAVPLDLHGCIWACFQLHGSHCLHCSPRCQKSVLYCMCQKELRQQSCWWSRCRLSKRDLTK